MPTRCSCCRGSASRARARSTRSSSSRRLPLDGIRTVAVTPESATSVVLTKVLLPGAVARPAGRAGRREAPDRRRGAQVGVRGPDAAPRPRPHVARADGPADGVRRVGRPDAAPSGPARARGRARRVGARRAERPGDARVRVGRAVRLPGRVPGALLREAALPLRPPRARRASTRSSSWRATSASSTRCRSSGS